MASSLQDQLKKVGLTDDRQLKKANSEKRRKRKRGGGLAENEVDETRLRVQRAASERASHDRRLNLQRTAAEEGKAIEAQIRQLIETSRQSRVDADVAYHFTVGTAIKKLLVSRRMHEQINHGSLAIVRLDEDYEVVPGAVAEKIARRDQDRVIVRNTARGCDEDDEYADYKVPDDLMW